MATYAKFNDFVEDLAEKVHNLGADTLQVALCNAANAPVATNGQLSDLTQIAYTNLSSQVVTTTSSTQSPAGTYTLNLNTLTLTASGAVAAFQYVVLFNQTATNDELIGFWNYGSEVTLADTETFEINFAEPIVSLT